MSFQGYNSECRPDLKIEMIEKQKKKNALQRETGSIRKLALENGNRELVIKKTELDRWFDCVAAIIKIYPYCCNCGEFITEKYYRHASAHIFPKAHFPSIATHPSNYLILGAGCGCHSEFDSSIENAAKMKIWKIAVERFRLFEYTITEKHKYLNLFIQNIKP